MHIGNVLESLRSIIDYLASRESLLVDGIFIYSLLVLVSVIIFFLFKHFGFFEIKDAKINEELAEADTDFYRKSVNFAVLPQKKKSSSH